MARDRKRPIRDAADEAGEAADAAEKSIETLTPKIEDALDAFGMLFATLDLRVDQTLSKFDRLLDKAYRGKRLDLHINLLNLFRRGRTVLSFTPVFEEV